MSFSELRFVETFDIPFAQLYSVKYSRATTPLLTVMAEIERSSKRRKIDSASDSHLATTDAQADGMSIGAKAADSDSVQSNGAGIINENGHLPRKHTDKVGSDVQNATADATENDPLQEIDAEPNDIADPPMSKSQQKKLLRKQQWEDGREDRKAWKKEKLKEKRARKRAAAAQAQESNDTPITTNGKPDSALAKKDQLQSKRHRPTQLPITFIFDCDFDDLMLDKERTSLASQLTRSYSDNFRAKFRNHMAVASFGGKLKQRFDTVLSKHYVKWKGVRFFDEDFVSVAEKSKEWMRGEKGGKLAGAFSPSPASVAEEGSTDEPAKEPAGVPIEADLENAEIVYLTSDSPNTLTELKLYSTYIIGGLVDRNRHKGICFKRACDRGMQTARLPIGLYMEMTSRFVLATNHVAEIMLRWLEFRDWGKAFMDVVPKRKGGVLKEKGGGVDDEIGEGDPEADGEEAPEADGEGENGILLEAKDAEVEEAVDTAVQDDVH